MTRRHVRGIWYVYLARCADESIYTGIALDVDRREAQHNAGKGARYTRGRRPVAVVYREKCGTRSEALKREARLRKCWREKMRLAGPAGIRCAGDRQASRHHQSDRSPKD